MAEANGGRMGQASSSAGAALYRGVQLQLRDAAALAAVQEGGLGDDAGVACRRLAP
jgi:hypothetical protein